MIRSSRATSWLRRRMAPSAPASGVSFSRRPPRSGRDRLPDRRSHPRRGRVSWRWSFPVFCTGIPSRRLLLPLDRRRLRVPDPLWRCARHPGDIIFADIDGVVVIPSRSSGGDGPGRAGEGRGRELRAAKCSKRAISCATSTTGSACSRRQSRSSYVALRIGIDTGGTFTDLVGYDGGAKPSSTASRLDPGCSGARAGGGAGRGRCRTTPVAEHRRRDHRGDERGAAAPGHPRPLRDDRRLRGRAVHRPPRQGRAL